MNFTSRKKEPPPGPRAQAPFQPPAEYATYPTLSMHYDLNQTPEQKRMYAERVWKWVDGFLKIPGAFAYRAYHTATGTSPQVLGILEFRSEEEAVAGSVHPDYRKFLEEVRSLGAVNLIVTVFRRSPFVREEKRG